MLLKYASDLRTAFKLISNFKIIYKSVHKKQVESGCSHNLSLLRRSLTRVYSLLTAKYLLDNKR